MTELKPCPFCGGEAEITDATRVLGVWNLIHRCTVLVPISCSFYSQEKAITAWNTRIQLAERDPIGAAIMRERAQDEIEYLSQVFGRNQDGDFYMSEKATIAASNALEEARRRVYAIPLPTHAETLAYALQLPEIKALVDALNVSMEKLVSMAHSEFDLVCNDADFDELTKDADAALAALEPKP
jgi:hypothetical protein